MRRLLTGLALAAAFFGAPAFPAQEVLDSPLPEGAPRAEPKGRAERPRRPRQTDPILEAVREAQDLLRRSRIEEGIARLRELHERHPDDWRVTGTLGHSLEATGQREEAILLYRRVADAAPDPGPSLIELQRLYRGAEMWPAALEVCLEYLRRVGEGEAWVADELESLIRTDRVGAEAVASIEKALRQAPGDPRLREVLLLAHLFHGDPARAMEAAASLDGDRRAGGALLLKYTRLAQEKGRLAAALAGCDRILSGEAAPAAKEQALLLRGQALRGLGRHNEALAAFEAAAAKPAHAVAARLEKAEILAGSLARPEEALAVYESAYEAMRRDRARGPGADRIRLTIADLQIRLGRPGDAAATYQDLSAHAAEEEARAQAQYRVGEMLFFQGKLKEAEEAWYAVTDSFPGQRWINDALEGILRIGENTDEGGVPLTAYAQAEYQRRLGRHDRALVLVEEAVQKFPQSRAIDDLLLERARLLLDLGRLAEARAAADTLAARFPESRLAPKGLVEVAQRLEADPLRTAEAEAIYLDVLLRYPGSLEAPLARAALQRRKENAAGSPPAEGGS